MYRVPVGGAPGDAVTVRVHAVLGDLVSHEADAVVRMVGPHRQLSDEFGLLTHAGARARDAFAELVRLEHGGTLPFGHAMTTTAGDLPARWLVHVAVPPYSPRGAEYLLPAGYRAVLAAADAVGARTLALVPIGMARPYWPLDVVTRIVTTTLPNTPTRVRETRLVVRTEAAVEVLAEALARG